MTHVKDPVCGMEIDVNDAVGKANYQGNDYYFCSEECQQTFLADPAAYVGVATGGDDPHDNDG